MLEYYEKQDLMMLEKDWTEGGEDYEKELKKIKIYERKR